MLERDGRGLRIRWSGRSGTILQLSICVWIILPPERGFKAMLLFFRISTHMNGPLNGWASFLCIFPRCECLT